MLFRIMTKRALAMRLKAYHRAHRDSYPVPRMCAVLEISPAGYHAWRERPVCGGATANAVLLAEIPHADHAGPTLVGPAMNWLKQIEKSKVNLGTGERMLVQNGKPDGKYLKTIPVARL
ncbi:hypothetical protein [Bradyrhizobium sp. DOA9]|uniref:hypothetical protein n=1 Tax=Bradyrhizobium sp. DOA9 TaxID=1126627 RepID=UPI000469AE02|nr:hypothetical protein [Bradyrhizobium sp. DOA9]GAJ37992.1 hypothetical protein BDOA9_0206100 [Bradyrhizobium sp. DOA9]